MLESDFHEKCLAHFSSIPGLCVFPIETEETIPGFPDLLLYNVVTHKAAFVELKVERNIGFSFKLTQIPFYIRYKVLPIFVLVYNEEDTGVYLSSVRCINFIPGRILYRTKDFKSIKYSLCHKDFDLLYNDIFRGL